MGVETREGLAALTLRVAVGLKAAKKELLSELPPLDLLVLISLYLNAPEGEPKLAERLAVKRESVSRSLSRLHAHELIEPLPRVERRLSYKLTRAGRTLVERALRRI